MLYLYGKKVCQCLIAIIPAVEHDFRAAGYIVDDLAGDITQGSYSTGVSQSAGTHAGGGALDVKPHLVNTADKLRIWRRRGFAMSHRLPSEGDWAEHGHGVLIGCPHLAPAAQRQVTAYRDGLNGLANKAADRGPRVPFTTYQEALAQWLHEQEEEMTPEDRKKLAEETATAILNHPITANGKSDALAQHFAENVVVDRAQALALAEIRRQLSAIAGRLTAIEGRL